MVKELPNTVFVLLAREIFLLQAVYIGIVLQHHVATHVYDVFVGVVLVSVLVELAMRAAVSRQIQEFYGF